MGTNEDYLDSLLKAAMESEQGSHEEQSETVENNLKLKEEQEIQVTDEIKETFPEDATQAEETFQEDATEAGGVSGESVEESENEDWNKPLDEDEIARMFAMMDAVEGGESQLQEGETQKEVEVQPEKEEIEETETSEAEEAEAEELQPELTMAALQESEQPQSPEEVEFDLDSVDDLDSLLGLREILPDHDTDGKAEEEEKENRAKDDQYEGQDVTELLDLLGDDDSDLAEINELLKKSDRNEMVEDDDMLAMLAGISDLEGMDENEVPSVQEEESTAEQTEEKPKRKKWGKKKKKSEEETAKEQNNGTEETPAQTENEDGGKKEKKTGFFKELFRTLTEEEDDIEDEQVFEPGIETELTEEGSARKKGKKDRKKKGKKTPETNEEILEELKEEDAAKAKKKKGKRSKKEKKRKEVSQPIIGQTSRKLPKKLVIRVFVLCFSLLAVILLLAVGLPGVIQVQSARRQFYRGNYEEAYQALLGQNLNESDQILLQKAEMIVRLEQKENLYRVYETAGDKQEALNALLEGVAYYMENEGTYDSLGIRENMEEAYMQLLILLETEYSISEERAREIIAVDSISYTYEIRSLTGEEGDLPLQNGETGQESEGAPEEEAERMPEEPPQDTDQELPEDLLEEELD